MGWVVVIAAKPLLEHVAVGGLVLLAAGGLAYTGGVVFYKWRRLPYNHAIWHGFVLAGSAFHYFAVLFYVIPGAATG
jgi:hemolysin III